MEANITQIKDFITLYLLDELKIAVNGYYRNFAIFSTLKLCELNEIRITNGSSPAYQYNHSNNKIPAAVSINSAIRLMEVGSMDVYPTEESVNQDRLSELPDSLIHLIFLFLSMREVVSTTLLLKRWNNLWSTVPYLNFHEDVIEIDGAIERIWNFVNRALLLWNGNKILKFIISFNNLFDSSLAGEMDLWVSFAMQNEVEELGIDLSYSPDDELMESTYWVPQCLNSCSSLRKLLLGAGESDERSFSITAEKRRRRVVIGG